jgi:cyclopropane fatty-acyl-phospholipid synthase-like methyltransferase
MQSEFAPHTARNAQPILEVLRTEFAAIASVLEIGSGTGQHATMLASAMPKLVWQPSDRPQNLAAIRGWLEQAAVPRVLDPIRLDVISDACPAQTYDAVFSANTAHIMSRMAVAKMFNIVSAVLRVGGSFCLYGPFNCNGKFNSESNAHFDRALRAEGGDMGIRDLDELHAYAVAGGLQHAGLYAMPANNLIAVWRRVDGEA